MLFIIPFVVDNYLAIIPPILHADTVSHLRVPKPTRRRRSTMRLGIENVCVGESGHPDLREINNNVGVAEIALRRV